MLISDQDLRDCIHRANFPLERREFAFTVISEGLKSFREHRVRRYYGVRGKLVKKPTAAHTAMAGRYDQSAARFVLIAALYRAWWCAFGTAPTLNHKKDHDSAFASFAMAIMAREGIGHIHQHLEEYWSFVKDQLARNDSHIVKSGISGGSKDAS